MKTGPIEKGERVDFRGKRNGEVLRVGRGTIWAVFETPYGSVPTSGPIDEFRRTQPPCEIRIAGYLVRSPGSAEHIVQIHRLSTGEMMEIDAAKFEGWLDKFWSKEF